MTLTLTSSSGQGGRIPEDGGAMTVTATMDKAAVGAVTVTISAAPAPHSVYPTQRARTDDYSLSTNTVLTFAEGATTSTGAVTISAVDNNLDENTNKRIRVTGTVSNNATIGRSRQQSAWWEFIIQDDDPQPLATVVLTPSTISENGGVATVTVEVANPTLRGDLELDVQVSASPLPPLRGDTLDNQAVAADVTLSANTRLTIASGETRSTGTVTITAVDNAVETRTRHLPVRAFNQNQSTVPMIFGPRPANWVLHSRDGAASHWFLLDLEDDDEPEITIAPPDGALITEGRLANFTLSADPAPLEDLVVKLMVAETGSFVTSANEGAQTQTIKANASSATYSVPTVNDGADEPAGQMTVTVASGDGYTVGSPSVATVTVHDDDATTVELRPVDTSAYEGSSTETASFSVLTNRGLLLPEALAVPLQFAGGALDTDFTLALDGAPTGVTLSGGTVTFTGEAGGAATTATVVLTASEDADTTDDMLSVSIPASSDTGSQRLKATSLHGGATGSGNVQITVTDDDGPPPDTPPGTSVASFAQGSSSAGEGAGTRSVTVSLSPAPTAAITLSYTVGGTAMAGSDFSISGSGTLSVASGVTTATVPVAITDDTAEESSETVVLTLTAGNGYTVGSVNTHTLTITDDDGTVQLPIPTPTVSLSVSPNPVTEGGTVTVTARLSEALSGGVTIPLTLTAGTAEAGDYGSLASITVTGGQTTGTGTVTTAQDADEDDETFTVALGTLPPEVTPGSPSSVVVTIRDGGTPPPPPPTVSLSASPNPVEEGQSVTVTARLSEALSGGVTIPLTLTAGTAEAGDYGSLASITVTGGQTTGTGTVTTAQDADEDDETFTVALGTLPPEVTPGSPSSVVVTIRDGGTPPPPPPTVSLSASPNPVEEGQSVTVTARLSEALSGGVTIPLTLTAGTAEAGDYGSLASITVTGGQTTGTGTVTTAQDADEDDETFTVALGTLPPEVTPGSPSSVVVTIRDGGTPPPPPPTVSLSASPNPVEEGQSVTVTARLSEALSGGVTIPLTLTAGTAEAGDYGSLASITVTGGQTTGTGTVTTAQDADEDDETFTVALGTLPPEVTPGSPSSVVVTIRDGGTPPPPPPTVSLSASPNPVEEGQSVTVTARLSEALSGGVTIPLTLTAGTAEAGDYGSLASITVTGGQTTGTGTVTTAQDADEDDETFTVALGTLPPEVTPGSPSSVVVTIRDGGTPPPPPPTVSLSASPNPVEEGQSVTVTARLSEALSGGVTIPLTLTAGTAEAGDYGSLASITVTGGQTTGTGTVTTAQDADEDDETFTVALGTLPPEVTPGSPSSVVVTIRDGGTPPPPPPTVSLSASPNPVEEGQSVTVTARLSEALSGGVTIPLTLTAGTAEAGDYGSLASITVTGGQTTGTGTVTTAQDADEDDETFTVALGSLPSDVTAGSPSSVLVTIRDDDGKTPPPPPPPPANRPPTVTASCDPCEVPRGEVALTALTAMASDPDGDSLTYDWSAPAGRFSEATDAATTRWTAPDKIGPVTIRVDVSDGHGGTASAGVTVEVANRPPVFESSEYALELRENVDGSRRPVDLGAVTASDPDGDELIYDMTSGDGSRFKAAGRDGVVRYAGPGEDFESEPNRYELAVRARDPYGAEAEARVVVTVVNVNEAPAAEDDEAVTDEDRALTVDVLANDTDPDGDGLRVESVSAPAHGTTRVASDGGVTYTPAANYHGVDRFTYVVSDPDGLTAEAAVEVTVLSVNDPPEAEDDEATTDEDRALTVDVLANDTDPDGDGLWVESVSAAAHGTTRIASDGGVTYTPAANYHGVDRFTYVVSDPDGLTAEAAVSVTVLSVNDAPIAVGVIPDQPLDEGGVSVDLDLTPFFDDADGDPLTYRAVSSDTDVATVGVAGAVLTLTPVVYGSAMVKVTAEDPGGLTGSQTFTVGVDDRLVRAVMSDTLAAMARSHLASARMTLGRRVEAGAAPASRLTVMGRSVPLGGASARRAAEQLVAGWLSSIAWSGASAQGPGGLFGPAGMSPGFGAYPGGGLGGPGGGLGGPGGGFGGPAVGGPAALGMPPVSSGALLYGLGGFGGSSETLLRGTEFELALGGGEDGRARAGRRWSVWGQGDIQTFRGAPTLLGYDARYDGDVRTGYVGVDAQLTRRWLAGVAVSRSGGRGDWEVGSARGRLRTTLTALHPYAQWLNGTTSVWTTAGGGWGGGEAETVREATGRVGASGLGLRLGLVELRRRVGAVGGGAELGLRADAAWAELRTGEGRESVDRLTAAVNQQRVGAEVSRPVRLGALALAPFGEAHLRRDEGGGQNGLGMEVAFGVGLTSGIVRLDVQGRTLAMHSAAGYGERGAGLTLTVGGRQREGLSLSVSPSWGDAASGTGTLWQEEVYRQYLSEEEQDAFAVDARGEYGMRLPNGGLLNWFGSYSHSPYGRSFLVGGSIGGLADALLPGR